MSKEIWRSGDLSATAFVGPYGEAYIQITWDTGYAQLNAEQSLSMAHAIIARLARVPGWRATD